MKRTLAILSLAAGAVAVTPALADHLNIDAESVWTKGAAVKISSVKIDEPGFVVLHAVQDGQPVVPASIGHTYVQAGTTENVEITADYALEEGEDFIAMLHYDTDGDGVYSFGEGSTDVDTPALNAEEQPYVKPFTAMAMDDMGGDAMMSEEDSMEGDAMMSEDDSDSDM